VSLAWEAQLCSESGGASGLRLEAKADATVITDPGPFAVGLLVPVSDFGAFGGW
jgi:hypothetical protein